MQCMCITRRDVSCKTGSSTVQIQSECVRSDMFDACVFIFIDGHIIKRPAGTYVVACVCSNLSSRPDPASRRSTGRRRGPPPAVRGPARAASARPATTPGRRTCKNVGASGRRAAGQRPPADDDARAARGTEEPRGAGRARIHGYTVTLRRPSALWPPHERWAGPRTRPPARSRLLDKLRDVSRLKSTQFGGRAALI